MDGPADQIAGFRGMAVLPHIKKLDDALGHFLVQITCKCGARRIAEPEVLARLCGASATLEAVGKRMRCSKCVTKAPRWSPFPFRASEAEDSPVESAMSATACGRGVPTAGDRG